ncbi:MAG: endospore germination permease [Clostridia bacterium]|nr:endospore germination permease [Clostridia bacterium]
MEITKGKISIRQAYIIVILALTAPSLRVIPNYVARIAKEAGWETPFLVIIPGVILVYVINSLFQKHQEDSLYEVFMSVFGKTITKIIFLVYGIWIVFLCSMYLRMFGERFVGTLLFNANMRALLGLMMIFVGIAVLKKFETLGRLSEILLLFFIILFTTVTLAILPQIHLENLYPVTYYDTLPVLKSVLPVFSLFSYITPLMILGDKISHKDKLKTYGKRALYVLAAFFLMLILSTVGLFGYSVSQQFIFPYYFVLNSVSLFGNVERLESLFISTWLASDFTIVLFFLFMAKQTAQKLLPIKKQIFYVIPLCIVIYVLAVMVFRNVSQVEQFASNILYYINIGLFALIPLIALIVGKVRKVV